MTEILYLGGAGDTDFIPKLVRSVTQEHVLKRVDYPGSIGPVNLTPNPYDWTEGIKESRQIGEKRLAARIQATPNVPIIIGYSLGAYVLSDFLENKARGKYPNLEIAQTITIGNPRRLTWGIAGSHKPFPISHGIRGKHFEIAAMNDVIANCPRGSVLRKLPYFVDAVTGLSRNSATQFMSLILTGTLANYWRLTDRDIELCWKYLDQTGHNKDYFQPSYQTLLRQALSYSA